MTLFRKRKETRKARESRAAAASAARRALSTGAATLVFGGLAAAFLVGAPRLQSSLAHRETAATLQVTFDWPPAPPSTGPASNAAVQPVPGTPKRTWLPASVQDELLTAASNALEKNPDPFNPDGLRRVAEAAAGSGWFEEIRAVHREPGGIVRVSGQWRIPAAVIRRDGRDFLVSRKGEILPLAFEEVGSSLQ